MRVQVPVEVRLDDERLLAQVALVLALAAMELHVYRQRALRRERLSAQLADVWPVAGVHHQVSLQRLAVGEALAASVAVVRPDVRVYLRMLLQVRLLLEAPSARVARIRHRAGVLAVVDTQRAVRPEPVAADVAAVRALVRVLAPVLGQVRRLRERLLAVVADERLQSAVLHVVLEQLRLLLEGEAAGLAGERALPGVDTLVLFQAVALRERLATVQADVFAPVVGICLLSLGLYRRRTVVGQLVRQELRNGLESRPTDVAEMSDDCKLRGGGFGIQDFGILIFVGRCPVPVVVLVLQILRLLLYTAAACINVSIGVSRQRIELTDASCSSASDKIVDDVLRQTDGRWLIPRWHCFVCVFRHVLAQHRWVLKIRLAFAADKHVGFHMSFMVSKKFTVARKSRSAGRALEVIPHSVPDPVVLEVSTTVCDLRALGTDETLVDEKMAAEKVVGLERLQAERADVRQTAQVKPQVLPQVRRRRKAVIALRADVRLCGAVRRQVLPQALFVFEGLATSRTPKRRFGAFENTSNHTFGFVKQHRRDVLGDSAVHPGSSSSRFQPVRFQVLPERRLAAELLDA